MYVSYCVDSSVGEGYGNQEGSGLGESLGVEYGFEVSFVFDFLVNEFRENWRVPQWDLTGGRCRGQGVHGNRTARVGHG